MKKAIVDRIVKSAALINQMPALTQADAEPAIAFYQGKKKFIPVAAPAHDPHPLGLGRLADRLDGRQDLDVFALMVRTLLGVKTIIERKDHVFARFGADDLKEPVASAQATFAPIVDTGQVFHFPCELFADIGEIQNQ